MTNGRWFAAAVASVAFLQAPAHGRAQTMDFEVGSRLAQSRAAGWDVEDLDTQAVRDTTQVKCGSASLRLAVRGGGHAARVSRSLPVEVVRGRTVVLSGWIRTSAAGSATLLIEVKGSDPVVVTLDEQAPAGTSEWLRYEVATAVPETARAVRIGMRHEGRGMSWFDALEVQVDGRPFNPESHPAWAPSQQEVEWLLRNATEFDSDQPGTGTSDLTHLLDIIGDARVVSLGEATHGTAEFFRMKHRIVEALAETTGTLVFAMEAPMTELRALNGYVAAGVGDPKALLAKMPFWMWASEEVLDLVEWMRAYNAAGRGRVEFWGFDTYSPEGAADSIRSFVTAADPAFLPTLESALQRVNAAWRDARSGVPDGAETQKLAEHVVTRLSGRAGEYVRAGHDAERVEWAIQYARLVLQSTSIAIHLAGNLGAASTVRDSSMAENTRWILDRSPAGTRAVLWAHNGHIMRHEGWMGHYLDRLFGDQQRVIGFTMHSGTFTAVGPAGLGAYPASQSGPGTIEHVFHATSRPRLILDLRNASADPNGAWLLRPLLFRQIGSVAMEEDFTPLDVGRRFDALIYFEQTMASRLLPR